MGVEFFLKKSSGSTDNESQEPQTGLLKIRAQTAPLQAIKEPDSWINALNRTPDG